MNKIQKFIAVYSFAAIAIFFATPYALKKIGTDFLTESTDRLTARVGFVVSETTEQPTEPAFLPVTIDPTSLEAKAAIVYDLKNGVVLFEKNAQMQLPLASITKLMTAHVAHMVLEAGDIVIISNTALSREGDSSLLPQEQWSAHTLSDFMLMTSSNDAAAALAGAVGNKIATEGELPHDAFIRAMNSSANDIGLRNTKFIDETGLDSEAGIATAYGSAQDVATLLGYLVRTESSILEATTASTAVYTSESGVSHAARNTNESIPNIPSLIAGKTGYTDLAGGNLAIVFDRGIHNPVAVVVLGSSKDGRFPDVQKLVQATLPQ